jgi:hypothetical protein
METAIVLRCLVTASRGRASTRAIAPDDVRGLEAWQTHLPMSHWLRPFYRTLTVFADACGLTFGVVGPTDSHQGVCGQIAGGGAARSARPSCCPAAHIHAYVAEPCRLVRFGRSRQPVTGDRADRRDHYNWALTGAAVIVRRFAAAEAG